MFCIFVRKFFIYDSILILRIGVPTLVFNLCHLLIQFYHFYHSIVHRNTPVYGVFSVCKAVPVMLFYFFQIELPLPDRVHQVPS